MNEAASGVVKKLNYKVGIANKVTTCLDKLNKQGVSVSSLTSDMLSRIIDDIYDKCMATGKPDSINSLNIDLMVHNGIIGIVLGNIGRNDSGDLDNTLTEMFKNNLDNYNKVSIAIVKVMWDKHRDVLDDIFRIIYTEDFNKTYLSCFYANDFSYEETTFPPHAIVRMMNMYIGDLFILEALFRTGMEFKFPFETAHITQDNVKKHGIDLVELLKQTGL